MAEWPLSEPASYFAGKPDTKAQNLKKKAYEKKAFQKRYIVKHKSFLYIYENEKAKLPKVSVALETYDLLERVSEENEPHCFHLKSSKDKKDVKQRTKPILVACPSSQDLDSWVAAIEGTRAKKETGSGTFRHDGKSEGERDAVLGEISKGAPELKHTETQDKSAPVIEKDVKIKKNVHGEAMEEIKKGKELKPTETKDKSAPAIGAHKLVVKDINKEHDLKHVDTIDKSAPQIDPAVKVKKNVHGEAMEEIKKGKDLKHAETRDASAPVIDKDTKVKPAPHKAVFEEIKKQKTDDE